MGGKTTTSTATMDQFRNSLLLKTFVADKIVILLFSHTLAIELPLTQIQKTL